MQSLQTQIKAVFSAEIDGDGNVSEDSPLIYMSWVEEDDESLTVVEGDKEAPRRMHDELAALARSDNACLLGVAVADELDDARALSETIGPETLAVMLWGQLDLAEVGQDIANEGEDELSVARPHERAVPLFGFRAGPRVAGIYKVE